MMKPVVEGRLLQALGLQAQDEVLEVGTGSGYVTACLARMAREVVSIDLLEDFTRLARARLDALAIGNVRLETADAFAYAPARQFDAVAITGAVATIPAAFAQWLKPGGRLFVVHGASPAQSAVRGTLRGSDLHLEGLFETDIPYLRGGEPIPRFRL
jgi:protein-L-isoaspartate(D-aspartate) O-methyltransferase